MYPAPIDDYVRPKTVAEAVQVLAQYQAGEAHFIAGGQSLMQAIKARLVAPKCLVDLQAVAELQGMSHTAQGVKIGAMTRYVEIATNPKLNGAHQALVDAASHVGDRQVRNRGTIGGSVCWNYLAACMPPTTLGLSATMHLVDSQGKPRAVVAEAFFKGPLETARADDEILVSIDLPATPKKAGSAYKKWGLVTDALPVIGVCAYLELDGNGACTTARVAVGGLAGGPKRSAAAERALVGKKPGDEAALAAALDSAAQELDTQSDLWADAEYRKQLIRVLGYDVVQTAFARAA